MGEGDDVIADFTLSAVPLRGPLAPIAALLGVSDVVLLECGNFGEWWSKIEALHPKVTERGWVWVNVWCWCRMPRSHILAVNLVTSPAARSAVVAWLEEHGHTAAYQSDEALLIALRHVCGLPPAPPSVDRNTDDIPF